VPTVAPERTEARRTFGPVVLVGIAAAVLSAVAGHQPWARAHGGTAGGSAALITFASDSRPGESPAAGALALVVLASWGVVLVTRGRVRRAVAALGVLAGLAVLAVVVVGYSSVPAAVRHAVSTVGVTDATVTRTAWYWIAVGSAVLGVLATGLAVRWAPAWPEMGQRYDGPRDQGRRAQPAPELTSESSPSDTDLWKALDDGRDPTL
jgi:uncharacterized membrane protein (TIGR02234 family)